jgi:hypothetical protein
METEETVVFEIDNIQIIKKGDLFFIRTFENGEFFESGDFISIENAKKSLGISDNRLIAEFLGWVYDQEKGEFEVSMETGLFANSDHREWAESYHFRHKSGFFLSTNYFLFETDWNWLIRVVEKIFSKEEQIKDDLIFKLNDALLEVNINSLYNACLNCIKWYNENK